MKIQKSLIALAMGGFGIGMTEFVMMGLLPDIAKSLDVTIPEAGHLVSLYALGVVVGAPLIAVYAGRLAPHKILMALMAFFSLAHLFAAAAPSYMALMIARFVAGLPHGAYFGVGAVVASRIAEKGKAAQAMSIMFAGLTVANVVGVPLGTAMGHYLSWRIVMGVIAVVGLTTLWALKLWMPPLAANADSNFRDELKIFGRFDAWLAIAITSIGTGGLFAWFSYIAPLATTNAGFSPGSMTFVLVLAGLGMTVGNIIGGRLADRYSPPKATAALFALMVICLIAISVTSHSQILFSILTFVTGGVAFAVISPVQMMIISTAEGSEILGSSLGQASFNVGNAIGAYLGGLPLVFGLGYEWPAAVGSGLAFVGCLLTFGMLYRHRNSQMTVRSSVVVPH